jgi:hypothetical protein
MFIGSSSEGKAVAEYLQDALQAHCDGDVWDQNVFEPSGETLGRLLAAAAEYDFATLVFSPDDIVERRGQTAWAPRDNVVLELGLFLGSLGRDRVFMICRQDHELTLPSDLLGVTVIRYQTRDRPNLRAQINPAALRIRERMATAGARRTLSNSSHRDTLRFVADLVSGVTSGSAGVRLQVADPERQHSWRGNLLAMLAEIFLQRSPDSYAAWLRPSTGSAKTLIPFLHRNLPEGYQHYSYGLDEGLAGRVWARGAAAAHSPQDPHDWWLLREGCDSMTYLCAPVGPPGGVGRVLGVGSDTGFEPADGDLDIVQLFGELLSTSLGSDADSGHERRLMRERVAGLDESLERFMVSSVAHPQEIELHNRLIAVAQELIPDDPIITALRAIDPKSPAAPTRGLLRMNLTQIQAAL